MGASANVSAYGGLIWNLPMNRDYQGDFEAINATLSLAETGISMTYFWAPTNSPFKGAFTSGVTKGFSIGYAPGAGASISYHQTIYEVVESYP